MERGERRKFFGVLALVFGSLMITATVVLVTFFAAPHWVGRVAGVAEEQPLTLLYILVFLVPIEILDIILTEICAAFSAARTMFVRRYLLSPGLRIGIVLVMIALGAGVTVLAYGYLLAGLAGVAYYAWSVRKLIRGAGLLDGGWPSGLRLPVRRVFSYTVPVMLADWCSVLMSTAGPLLLGYFSDMSAVALFQVVIPLTTVNLVVAQAFGVLFEPAASRLASRGDRVGLETLYWRSAAWVAVLSFPGFAISFTASGPLTTILYGQRYAEAGPILSILALGAFLDTVLGFNAETLRVAGRLNWLVGVNMVSAATNLALNVLLIPEMGALGAGIATGASWAVFAVLKQIALHAAVGVPGLHASVGGIHAAIAAAVAGLVVVRIIWPSDAPALVAAAVLAALAVLLRGRATLSITETFPELGRWGFVKALLG